MTRTRTCGIALSPGSQSPGHLVVTQPGAHRVGTTRYVLTMGRRSPRSARRAPYGVLGASVTHPAKGEILVKIEVPFIRSTKSPTRG